MKKSRNLKKTVAAGFTMTTLAVLLSGCFGGGGSAAPAAAPAAGFGGAVVKGPVSSAKVYVDINKKGDCALVMADPLAPWTTTNSSGVFAFSAASAPAGQYVVCATGGTDSITGADLSNTTLTAPPSANPVVTPMTTLVVGQLQAAGGNLNNATAAQITTAQNTIATSLSLPASAIIPATAADAQTVEVQANAVQSMLANAAKIVAAAAASGTLQTDVYSAAIRGVASAVAANTATPVNLQTLNTAGYSTLTNNAIKATIAAASNVPAVARMDAVTVADAAAPAAAAAIQSVGASTTAALMITNVANNNSALTLVATVLTNFTNSMTTAIVNAIKANVGGATSYTSVVSSLQGAVNAYAALPASGVTAAAFTAVQASAVAAINSANLAAVSGLSAASATAVAGTLGISVNASGVPTTATVSTNALLLSLPTVTGSAGPASVSTATTPYSVTVTGPLQSAGMTVAVDGTATTLPAAPVPVMISVAETTGNRRLVMMVDQVSLAKTAAGVVTVSVPAAAKLYALGVNTAGTPFTATLLNAAQNIFTSANGVVTINWANTALQSALTTANAGFTNNVSLAKGSFQVKLAIAGVTLYKTDAAGGTAPADVLTLTTTGLSTTAAAAAAALFPASTFTGQGVTINATVN